MEEGKNEGRKGEENFARANQGILLLNLEKHTHTHISPVRGLTSMSWSRSSVFHRPPTGWPDWLMTAHLSWCSTCSVYKARVCARKCLYVHAHTHTLYISARLALCTALAATACTHWFTSGEWWRGERRGWSQRGGEEEEEEDSNNGGEWGKGGGRRKERTWGKRNERRMMKRVKRDKRDRNKERMEEGGSNEGKRDWCMFYSLTANTSLITAAETAAWVWSLHVCVWGVSNNV